MTINALQLIFKGKLLTPTSVAHRRNGTTTLTWHVDDNDDRFVLVAESSHSEDFLLVYRDERKVEAAIKDDAEEIVSWIKSYLRKLQTVKTEGWVGP